MTRTTPPFRADHAGSLLRPPGLLRAREDFAAGRIPAEELRGIEDDAIRAAVQMQEEVGLQSATDGEFRRASWHMDFIYQLDGITKARDDLKDEFRNEAGTIEFTPAAALRVEGEIGLRHTIFEEDFEALRAMTNSTITPKLTIPSPSMVHYRGGHAAINENVYPDLEAFWEDLAAAYARGVRALGELGCTYLQFDDTSFAYLNDPRQREHLARLGEDAEHQHETYIRTINQALADKPAGMTVTTHMCRGNFRSSWVAEGGYEFVAEALFNELEVDGFFLEYDDARSGGFEPLRFVPRDKMVVLGLVTTKRGELESKEELKRRIEDASRFVPIEQLCLSPQCGFSSTVEGNALTYEQQVDKLRLIVSRPRKRCGPDASTDIQHFGASRHAPLQAVHAGGRLEEGALRVIAHIYGEPGPHGVVRGAAAARQVSRLEGQLGNIRVVQRVSDLLEDEAGRGLEIQGVLRRSGRLR